VSIIYFPLLAAGVTAIHLFHEAQNLGARRWRAGIRGLRGEHSEGSSVRRSRCQRVDWVKVGREGEGRL